jgi:hypothetical protein
MPRLTEVWGCEINNGVYGDYGVADGEDNGEREAASVVLAAIDETAPQWRAWSMRRMIWFGVFGIIVVWSVFALGDWPRDRPHAPLHDGRRAGLRDAIKKALEIAAHASVAVTMIFPLLRFG